MLQKVSLHLVAARGSPSKPSVRLPWPTLVINIVNITVSNEPKLVELVEELNNPEDSNATITCSVGSGELQSLTYDWYKDEEKLSPRANKVRIDIPVDNYQSTLRIFNLKPSDAGLYSCIARNRFGQGKISTRLNVNGESSCKK